jgi:DNA-binding LacI/PurR family transcriptional regulator
MARTTIADVARRAGVSKGLVSFALNDRPGVAPETRERILAVAHDLGWTPSLRARSLSTDRAFALGLVIARDPDILAADPFFPAFIAGLESVLGPAGQSLVLSMVPTEEAERASYRTLAADGRVDGVVLSDLRHQDPRIALARELGLHAVTLGVPDVASSFPVASLDDGPGMRALVDHLVELGHERVAHVAGPSTMLHGIRRRDEFERAVAASGVEGTVIETDFSAADGARATRELLAGGHRPTAIVYANDPMAIAGIGVAQRIGYRVPDDLSVAGFDGSEVGEYLHPALTTVVTPVRDWGRAAAEILLRVVGGEPAHDVTLPPARLVIRESTAAPSTENR